MPYQNNIPQPNDQLSNSQADLLGNFQELLTWAQVNHVGIDMANANNGYHSYVTMPTQARLAGGNPLLGVNRVNLYVDNTAGNAGEPVLQFTNSLLVYPFTKSGGTLGALGGQGFFYCGRKFILYSRGTIAAGGMLQIFLDIERAALAGNETNYNSVDTVLLTPTNNNFVYMSNLNANAPANFTVTGPNGSRFIWCAIGNNNGAT